MTDNVTKILSKLDSEVSVYSRYTNRNPMKGVTLDKSKNKYRIVINDTRKCVDTLEEACNAGLHNIRTNIDGRCRILSHINDANEMTEMQFVYCGQQFISFWVSDTMMFDILHIANIIVSTDDSRKRKYNEYSAHIVCGIIEQNQFGGGSKNPLPIRRIRRLLHPRTDQ